jgi:hypothetical protein
MREKENIKQIKNEKLKGIVEAFPEVMFVHRMEENISAASLKFRICVR